MVRFYPECRRARHTVTRLCRCGGLTPLFSPTRRRLAKSVSRLLSSYGNLQTFQHSNVPTFLRSIPFRITSFAHPHHLTLTESYSYKKEGRGWVPGHLAPSQAQSTCATHGNTRNPNLFIHLLRDSLGVQGVGGLSFVSARLRVLCVSALSFSGIHLDASPEAGSSR
jgi:hypothetical protein